MTDKALTGRVRLAYWLAIFMSLYHLLYISGLLWYLDLYIQTPSHRAAHIGLSLIVGFLFTKRVRKSVKDKDKIPWFEVAAISVAFGWNIYMFFFFLAIGINGTNPPHPPHLAIYAAPLSLSPR